MHAAEVSATAVELPSLAMRLRMETRDAHTRAERHPMQGRLVRGLSSRSEYGAYVGQLIHVHRELDKALKERGASWPSLGAMIQPYHAHEQAARLDYADLVPGDATPEPWPTTRAFLAIIDRARKSESLDLVGIWYVLEGSTNGGRFIAKAFRGALGFGDERGLRLMDPHADAVRERWEAWRAGCDALNLTPAQQDAVVAAASATFDAVYDLNEEWRIKAGVPASAPR